MVDELALRHIMACKDAIFRHDKNELRRRLSKCQFKPSALEQLADYARLAGHEDLIELIEQADNLPR